MDPFIWPVQYPYNPHPSTPSPPITLGSLVHNLPWPEPAVPFLKKPVVDSYGLPCSPVTGLSQYAEATPGHTREEHMAWLNSSQGFEFVAQTRGFDHQVHLSADIETAINVGKRHGKPVILKINAAKMHEKGIEFYQSENGVWLTEYVDPRYFSVWEEEKE